MMDMTPVDNTNARRLAAAVLQQAVEDMKNPNEDPEVRMTARAFLGSEDGLAMLEMLGISRVMIAVKLGI